MVTGDRQDIAYLEKYFGSVYSCANLDEGGLENVRFHQHSKPTEGSIGSCVYKGPGTESEINIRPANMRDFKYDA